jgi:hypothetical protein
LTASLITQPLATACGHCGSFFRIVNSCTAAVLLLDLLSLLNLLQQQLLLLPLLQVL